jgi:hypothetical protein
VRDARALSAGDAVTVRVARGRFQAEVKRVESEESEK